LLKYTNDENAIRTTTTNNFTKDVAGAGGIVFLKRGGETLKLRHCRHLYKKLS